MASVDGVGLIFTLESLQKSFAGLGKHLVCDSYGVSLEVLWQFQNACADIAIRLFNRLASDNSG